MLISVVIPFYNSQEWLPRCLKSLESNEGNFEYILVDDSSTDRSRAIVEACADSRVVLVDNEHVKGVSGARNTGIEHATGEYLTFLDADDSFLPNAYQTLSRIASTGLDVYQLNHMRQYATTRKLKYVNLAGIYALDAAPKCWWAVWNKLLKRESLEARFDESLDYGEDAVFMLHVLEKHKGIKHDDSAVICRHFDNDHSLARSKTLNSVVKQVRAIEEFMLTAKYARGLAYEHIIEIWTSPVIEDLVYA